MWIYPYHHICPPVVIPGCGCGYGHCPTCGRPHIRQWPVHSQPVWQPPQPRIWVNDHTSVVNRLGGN